MATKARAKRKRKTVNFNANAFRKAHGIMPRGVAFWIFYFVDKPQDPWLARRPDQSWRALSYMDAKAEAAVEAHRRGVTSVRVDPHPL